MEYSIGGEQVWGQRRHRYVSWVPAQPGSYSPICSPGWESDSIVLEHRDRSYVEQRVRAGVLEQGTVDLLHEIGAGERLAREGLVHRGIYLQFDGQRHHVPMSELTGGRAITVYGQQEVVKDLIRTRLDGGGQILFEAEVVSCPRHRERKTARDLQPQRRPARTPMRLCCWLRWISRRLPLGDSRRVPCGFTKESTRLAGWAYLPHAAPSSDELVYSCHPSWFRAAQHALAPGEPPLPPMRARREYRGVAGRAYLAGVVHAIGTGRWLDFAEGPIFEKGVTAMRSFVVEPMRYGNLFLAGDAAHVVPATGAKGLNLAVADVRVLADALSAWYKEGRRDLLDAYSATCLRRVWRAQHFSNWMTSLLHRLSDDPFQQQLQLSELRYVTTSRAAATSLAENYVGLAKV